MADADKTKKILLGVGGGCLGLVLLCCLSGFGVHFARSSSVGGAAQEHVERFLSQVQARDWNAALDTSTSHYDRDLYGADRHQACVQDTALGDLTSYDCHDVDAQAFEGDADVMCTIQSASRGEVEIAINVNSADDMPYLGFYWFTSRDDFGAQWAADDCASWSGKMYFHEPPDGFVRP